MGNCSQCRGYTGVLGLQAEMCTDKSPNPFCNGLRRLHLHLRGMLDVSEWMLNEEMSETHELRLGLPRTAGVVVTNKQTNNNSK